MNPDRHADSRQLVIREKHKEEKKMSKIVEALKMLYFEYGMELEKEV